jgi:hypothetical protein
VEVKKLADEIQITKYQLQEIIRYYELKQKGLDVLAGILRTSEFPDLDMAKFERALKEGKVKVI